MSGITPFTTIGPFSALALTAKAPKSGYALSQYAGASMAPADTLGERIRIVGTASNGFGEAFPLTLIEVWQADARGHYAHPRDGGAQSNASFKGFGRVETEEDGGFVLETIKPGRVPWPDGRLQAPHLSLQIMAPVIMVTLYTRVYFADELSNAEDPVLALVPAERRNTLIARKESNGVYRIDIRTKGPEETVFFDY